MNIEQERLYGFGSYLSIRCTTIAVLFHLFHSPVALPFHPIQGKRREKLHPRHRQFRRQINLQCILIGKTSWNISRRFPWIGWKGNATGEWNKWKRTAIVVHAVGKNVQSTWKSWIGMLVRQTQTRRQQSLELIVKIYAGRMGDEYSAK
jgi:hypothetical protein